MVESGLITIEDVLEQIVGDIIDEHDSVETSSNIKKIKNSLYSVDGSTTLEEFNDFLRVTIKVQIFDTISGLLISKFKGLPKTHDVINIDNYKFQIKFLIKEELEVYRLK